MDDRCVVPVMKQVLAPSFRALEAPSVQHARLRCEAPLRRADAKRLAAQLRVVLACMAMDEVSLGQWRPPTLAVAPRSRAVGSAKRMETAFVRLSAESHVHRSAAQTDPIDASARAAEEADGDLTPRGSDS